MEHHSLTIFTEKDLFENLEIGKLYQQQHPTTVFVKKGEVEVSVQINEVFLDANSVLLLDPKSIYKIQRISTDFEARVVVYENEYVQKLGLKLNKLQVFKHFRTHIDKIAKLPEEEINFLWAQIAVIKKILTKKIRLHYQQEILENLFAGFIYSLSDLLLRQEERQDKVMNRQDDISFTFIKNVFDHFKNEKTLSYYADLQTLTTRHLSTVVKNVTGKTANKIISEFVMNEAKILLTSTSLSVNEIAEQLKFSDPYSFSHFFKKHSESSPTKYRQHSTK